MRVKILNMVGLGDDAKRTRIQSVLFHARIYVEEHTLLITATVQGPRWY